MTGRRRKPWKRPKDLPKGEIWPPDRGLHPIPESRKEEVRTREPVGDEAEEGAHFAESGLE